MVKLIFIVMIEAIVGIMAASALLAVLVPLLVGHQVITPGDRAAAMLIGAVLLAGIAMVVLRPGSALRRRRG